MAFELLNHERELPFWRCAARQTPAYDAVVPTDCGDIAMIERDRSDGTALLVLLDISGHGRATAPYAAHLIHSLQTDDHFSNLPLREFIERVHGLMRGVWTRSYKFACGLFVTVPLTASERHPQIVNAAIPPPFLQQQSDWNTLALPTIGLLGCERAAGWVYEVSEQPFGDADACLLATDGVTESIGQQHGHGIANEMVLSLLKGLPPELPFAERFNQLWERVGETAGSKWRTDDATAIWLEKL